MAEGMLVLFRSVARLRNVGSCRQLAALRVERRGLRVATGGSARSAASVIDHVEQTSTITDGKTIHVPSTTHDPAREKVDTMFDNAKEAFTSKTNFELLRGYTVFQMCSVKFFVNKNKQVMIILPHDANASAVYAVGKNAKHLAVRQTCAQ